MVRILDEDRAFVVPAWVRDIESFRRWSDTDDFPQDRPVWWLNGEVWIDMGREQIFTYVLLKTRISARLSLLSEEGDLGLFFGDGVLLSNFAANISGNPDGTFLARETLVSDRIRLLEGSKGGYTEIQGSPDMVLEVVSDSSVAKDYELLRKAYWEADVRESWRVDVRRGALKFDILRHTPRGYVATRKQDGWVKSAVFGKSFKLSRRANDRRQPEFTLAVR
jgi:Uma2 family endonuclease